MTECSAYRRHDGICANGFIQTYPCWGGTECSMCGKPSTKLPHCLRDDLPERWLTKAGKPLFYREAKIAASKSQS